MAEPGPSCVGESVRLSVGNPAHGGSCVARHEGRAVFVRHALPGEVVTARITEDRGGYLFADAVEIHDASPDRVPAPCPHAGPGRCGGCDWQHATGAAQRALKAQVVREQLTRLGGVDAATAAALVPQVEKLPGGLLGWRTRNTYAVGADGRPGLHRHRSHELEHVERCPLGAPGVGDADVLRERWPGRSGVEVVGADGAPVSVLGHRPGPGRQARGRRPPDVVQLLAGPAQRRHRLLGREYAVRAGGFWQVHPAAAETFARAVLSGLAPEPGERVLDLYSGAGALTGVLADAVGPAGRVVGVESAGTAVEDAAGNLADLPQAEVRRGRVSGPLVTALTAELDAIDLVVLDPPRAGAGREVIEAVLRAGPRAVGYVACDPAALARDVRTAVDAGWELRSVRAFDAFPMTFHVECVAVLTPSVAPR